MNLSVLCQIPLFRSLSDQELEGLFLDLKIEPVHFRKGEMLTMQDEPVNRLILLLTGSVTAEMTDEAGHVVKVEDIEAPSPLAILFLFGRDNKFPVQATAREDSTALIIPKKAVLSMLSSNQTLLKNYLDSSADFAARLGRKLHLVSLRTIRQKIAVYLLDLRRKQGSETIMLDKSKRALADYFGVARPSLEREITRMQTEGLILAQCRSITIKDHARLAHLINHG